MLARSLLFFTILALTPFSLADSLILVGATVIDPSANQPKYRASVLIDGEMISKVGDIDLEALPDETRVIDVSGKYIIPGLIDTHHHLHFGDDDSPWEPDRVLEILPLWGVTTIFDTAIDMESFETLKAEGQSHGPRARFFAVGLTFGAKDGWGGTLNGGYTPATEAEARASVKELAASGVDGIKLVYDDMSVFGTGPWPVLDEAVMKAIIDEAHQQSLTSYVHAPMLENAKVALRAGADVLVHGIISEAVDQEFLDLMLGSGAVYMPTHILYEQGANKPAMSQRFESLDSRELVDKSIYAAMWNSREQNPTTGAKLPILRENLRSVVNAGIPVAMGSDTGVPGVLAGISSQMELVLYVESAMTPQEALRAATSTAAATIGQQDMLGRIEAGKYADLVVLEQDPLTDIRNIRHIWAVLVNGIFAVAPLPIR